MYVCGALIVSDQSSAHTREVAPWPRIAGAFVLMLGVCNRAASLKMSAQQDARAILERVWTRTGLIRLNDGG